MANDSNSSNRVLVKLRPSTTLKAAASRVALRPLYEDRPPTQAMGLNAESQWFLADLPSGGPTPWDMAHARLADELGVAASDIQFAEPDLVHDVFIDDSGSEAAGIGFAAQDFKCDVAIARDGTHGKPLGARDGWHLDGGFSQLENARNFVLFGNRNSGHPDSTERFTRIAHLDTGYMREHVTTPQFIRRELERSFVDKDVDRQSAEDPDNKVFVLDNSGHGTGTISVLAGRDFGSLAIGGAPFADIVPLRIADSVVLLKTSAFAQALSYATDIQCDVVTMSMGGLPSQAWSEAVDRAYMEGVCVVAAAGNNQKGLPTKHIVYPARYARVIAACGAMADGSPYNGIKAMQGNFGPDSQMKTAMSAYTPNIPWARFGCKDQVRMNGEGTSAATPQIAAAAALWFEKYKATLPRDWHRVEAVRHALFSSADKSGNNESKLGQGVLRARKALDVLPVLDLKQSKELKDSWAFLRVITGLGIAERPVREEMYNLELLQLWLKSPELQKLVPDPELELPNRKSQKQFMDAVIEDKRASNALRKHLAGRYPAVTGDSVTFKPEIADVVPEVRPACPPPPTLRPPPYRRLRAYAVDPSLANRLATATINEVTLKVRWEDLNPGPDGEYLRVDDIGPTTDEQYPPVDLNAPELIARDGWAPSEGNPLFHQQMVYAVAMRTIERFELALGRPVLWRPGVNKDDASKPIFRRQLLVRPHALQQANAFYSPSDLALKFGYFESIEDVDGTPTSGSYVYSCLSHDIVAHETTHAILDGMHHRLSEPSNPDVLAFHEGFSDVVALLQHLALPELLEAEIARVRGDLEAETMLGSLAIQFGYAVGGRGALRNAIGRRVDGVWKRDKPDPSAMKRVLTPHSRGSLLVGAVFDAFVAIYKSRIADLLRIATGGTGILPTGAIHPDLVKRLSDEAVTASQHVLNMCIRALDYLPPVDLTYFEFLRAVITADSDVVRDDRYNYRIAFVEAFRRHGIQPLDSPGNKTGKPRPLSVDTLRWEGFELAKLKGDDAKQIVDHTRGIVRQLKKFADDCFYLSDREKLFDVTVRYSRKLDQHVNDAIQKLPSFGEALGLDPTIKVSVEQLRRCIRVTPEGRHIPQVIMTLTQEQPQAADAATKTPAFTFRGGCTLVIDLSASEVKYTIIKSVTSKRKDRKERTAAFHRETAADAYRALYFDTARGEPFAILHALADDGGSA